MFLNKALIYFLKLKGVECGMLIDASSKHLNLKLNEKSSYLTTFSCPFGRYQCIRPPFGAASVDDIFQWETVIIILIIIYLYSMQ